MAYLLRIIRDIVEKNPRFRRALGNVTFPANSNPTTTLRWKDVQVIVKSITTSGNRLSPDYFMCTQLGRAILAKVVDKDGLFIEWIKEIDPTHKTPQPGVYIMNVDFVDEETRDVGLSVQKYIWTEGTYKNAVGSIVYFRPGVIDPSTNQQVDLTTLRAVDGNANPVQFNALNSSFGGTLTLLTPVDRLVLFFSNGTQLQPMTDFWYQREATEVIARNVGGDVLVNILEPYVTMTLTDQTGYEFRPNIDFIFYSGPQWLKLSQWTPPGTTVTANLVVKVDPTTANATHPENILNVGLQPGQSLVSNQVFVQTSGYNYTSADVTPNSDGTITLPNLLLPGDSVRWEVRIEAGQFKAMAKKWELNSLVIVDPNTIKFKTPIPLQEQPAGTPKPEPVQATAGEPLLDANGNLQFIFPGLWLAFGDMAIVGDQAAILVSPSITETCQVYGSKENITFTLEFKSNDLQTSSDLSEMVKQYLLITSRKNVEADGLTIQESTRDYRGEQRDPSGTASNYVYDVSVTGAADWKVYKPLVTRLLSFEITQVPTVQGTTSRIDNTPRAQAFGAQRFIPSYC